MVIWLRLSSDLVPSARQTQKLHNSYKAHIMESSIMQNVSKTYRKISRVQHLLILPRRTGSKYCLVTLVVVMALVLVYNRNVNIVRRTKTAMGKSEFLYFKSSLSGVVKGEDSEIMERIDWNNYTLMYEESLMTGPGEHGLPVTMQLYPEEQNLSDVLFERHRLNAFISSRISLDRSIGDHRYESCKKRLFLKDLPKNSVSVVISFHNEHSSTILRTVHSVINRSPSNILREVILVDDASNYDYLIQPLEDYIKKHFNKVLLIRNQRRLGLMLTRVAGADASNGSYLIFFDAHIEVNYNYLPPLLEPIVLDYKTISVPMTDGIDHKDFRYNEFGPDRGAFDWTLFYQRFPLLKKDLIDITQPREVPTMLGCAFAISRRWWEEIGKFDPGLKVWGGEQYEISFKTWQCGGRILDIPCSRIGHVFRKKMPYKLDSEELSINFLRVASVWMDEYKQYVVRRISYIRDKDPGDLKEQLDIRRRLNCKPFKWYLSRVAPDIVENFPLVDPPRPSFGVLKSAVNTTLCVTIRSTIDNEDFPSVRLDRCIPGRNSAIEYSWKHQIKTFGGGLCFVPTMGKIRTSTCSLNGTRQKFGWDPDSGWLVSLDSGRCVRADIETRTLDMQPCGRHPSMSWRFVNGAVNRSLVHSDWEKSKQMLINYNKWSKE